MISGQHMQNTHTLSHTHSRTYTRTYIHTHTASSPLPRPHTCMYVHACVYIHMYIHMHMYTCTHEYTRVCMHVLQTSATAASPRLSVPHQLLAPIWLYEVSAVMTVTCPVRITNGQSPWGACPVTTVEIPVHTCVFVFVCLHPCVCVCVCVCFCACVYIHTFIRTYVRTYIHTYIHTYI